MRIGLLLGSVSRLGGGVFEAVLAHARLIKSLGHQPVVIGLADAHSADDRARFGDIPVLAAPVKVRAMGYAPGLGALLEQAELDLLHLHGVWIYPSHPATRWARRTGRPYLISPHGMLDPWIVGRGRLKKAVARIGYERASWRRADMFHALTDAEAADIRIQTGSDRVAVIPNAIHPAPPGPMPEPTGAYLLYLGRIHPKKNVAALAEAWARVRRAGRAGDVRLELYGWGEAQDVAALEAQLAALDEPSIAYRGPVHGAQKDALIRAARFMVLPSFSEGLPMAILEAWAEGVPTLMSQACNLPAGFAHGAAIDTGTTPEAIAQALGAALALDEPQRAVMGDRARALATADFAPGTVAGRWHALYERLVRERAGR